MVGGSEFIHIRAYFRQHSWIVSYVRYSTDISGLYYLYELIYIVYPCRIRINFQAIDNFRAWFYISSGKYSLVCEFPTN